MIRLHAFLRVPVSLPWKRCQPLNVATLIIPILVILPACMEKRMTLEEAKQVTISMSEKAFTPPPPNDQGHPCNPGRDFTGRK